MAQTTKNREIQVQKPAQSLAHFQTKLGKGEEEDGGLLKPILIGVAALVLVGVALWRLGRLPDPGRGEARGGPFGPADGSRRRWRDTRAAGRNGKAHARAAGSPGGPGGRGAFLPQGRHRGAAGQLAPGPGRQGAGPGQGRGSPGARSGWPSGPWPWARPQAARAQLDPLRAKATPGEPWAEAFWASQLDADRLAGDRAQALKDLAEYKARFKGRADTSAFEGLIQSI